MKIIVTGAAGFIGSSLVDALLAQGHTVVGVDNMSTGIPRFLNDARKNPRFQFHQLDLFLDQKKLSQAFTSDVDHVFHFAANADVRHGLKHPTRDLEQNTLVTSNVLEAMREANIKSIAFTSTGSVYGEATVFPTPEHAPFPLQTSLYGASKLSGEAMMSAYAEGYGMRATIYRFVSVVGERYTHGHIFDFVKALEQNPKELRVLGNGKQRKSYIYIQDALAAMTHILSRPTDHPVEVYNLGTDEYVEVDQSIEVICDELGVAPKRNYTGGDRGWVGDNPFIFLDCSKLRATGWKPKLSIAEGVRKTVRYLKANPWVFEERKEL